MRHLNLPCQPAASIDHERTLVAETAIEAAGGGHLVGLHRHARVRGCWTATVAREHGHAVVELDARTGTVLVRPAALWHAA